MSIITSDKYTSECLIDAPIRPNARPHPSFLVHPSLRSFPVAAVPLAALPCLLLTSYPSTDLSLVLVQDLLSGLVAADPGYFPCLRTSLSLGSARQELNPLDLVPALVLGARHVGVLHTDLRSLCRIEGLRSGVAVVWEPFPLASVRALPLLGPWCSFSELPLLFQWLQCRLVAILVHLSLLSLVDWALQIDSRSWAFARSWLWFALEARVSCLPRRSTTGVAFVSCQAQLRVFSTRFSSLFVLFGELLLRTLVFRWLDGSALARWLSSLLDLALTVAFQMSPDLTFVYHSGLDLMIPRVSQLDPGVTFPALRLRALVHPCARRWVWR